MRPAIEIDDEEIAGFCLQNRIRRLALFGSVIRNDFGPESDIDVLVEFEPNHHLGYGFITLQDELSELLGRPVDLNTPEDLSRYFRDDVIRGAFVIFDAEATRVA